MVGSKESPSWLATDFILSYFSRNRAEAITAYIRFIGDGVNKKIGDDLQHQIFLGDDAFVEKHQLMAELLEGNINEIPVTQRSIISLTLDEYQAQYIDKHHTIYNAYLSEQYTQKQIAKHFGLHYSRVSQIISKLKT